VRRGVGLVLVFGGAYQGKLDYVFERFGLSEDDVFRCTVDSSDMPGGKRVIYELDKWILALISEGVYSEAEVARLIAQCKDSVVICNDISCGVVPVEPVQRLWREAVGRALAAFAGEADEVVRLFCGIPTVLKVGGTCVGHDAPGAP